MSCRWHQEGLTQRCLRTLSQEASPHTGPHTWHTMTSPKASPSRSCAVALLETGWRGERENKAEKTSETSGKGMGIRVCILRGSSLVPPSQAAQIKEERHRDISALHSSVSEVMETDSPVMPKAKPCSGHTESQFVQEGTRVQ